MVPGDEGGHLSLTDVYGCKSLSSESPQREPGMHCHPTVWWTGSVYRLACCRKWTQYSGPENLSRAARRHNQTPVVLHTQCHCTVCLWHALMSMGCPPGAGGNPASFHEQICSDEPCGPTKVCTLLPQARVSTDASLCWLCVHAGAALGQALRRAGGPEQASSGAAESKSAQEAHRKQMCLQLQVRPSPPLCVQ